MKKIVTCLVSLFLAVPAAAFADGKPSARNMPATLGAPGPEVCTLEIDGSSVEVELTCDGLSSCQADKSVWRDLATECLGIPRDASVEDARKARKPPAAKPPQKPRPKAATQKPRPKAATQKKPEAPKRPGSSTLMRVNEGETSCPNGGHRISVGLDKDGDGKLSDAEVEQAFAVCNGRDGQDGAQGPAGPRGPAGKKGDRGPAGRDGRDGRDGKDGGDGSRVNLGLGVMSSMLVAPAPHVPTAYAVGPSAQLQFGLSDKWELVLEGAWAPGRDRATMLHAGVARYLKPWLFVSAGVYGEWIGLVENRAKAQYVGLAKGGGVRWTRGNVSVRVELTGFIGGTGFDDKWMVPVFGGTGSASLTWSW